MRQCKRNDIRNPLDETHLAVVKGLPTKKFQSKCDKSKSAHDVVRTEGDTC